MALDLPAALLLDGGMGTGLIARGLDVRAEATAQWNLSRPDEVLAVHREHREAGAGALHTNTFVANRLALAGLDVDVRECNLAAVRLAREAADGALVIGDIGPTGAVPPPEGDADLTELEEVFAEQAALLCEGGVDLLHVETMVHPKELRAALRGCRNAAPSLPVIVSITCRRHGTDYRSTMGFCSDQLAQVALEERVDGLGVNCNLPPAALVALVDRWAAHGLPIFAQPTAAPEGAAPLYPAQFAAGVMALFDAGARAVGGCCGTSGTELAAARELLDKRELNRTQRGY